MRRGEIVAERTVADIDLLTVESLIMPKASYPPVKAE